MKDIDNNINKQFEEKKGRAVGPFKYIELNVSPAEAKEWVDTWKSSDKANIDSNIKFSYLMTVVLADNTRSKETFKATEDQIEFMDALFGSDNEAVDIIKGFVENNSKTSPGLYIPQIKEGLFTSLLKNQPGDKEVENSRQILKNSVLKTTGINIDANKGNVNTDVVLNDNLENADVENDNHENGSEYNDDDNISENDDRKSDAEEIIKVGVDQKNIVNDNTEVDVNNNDDADEYNIDNEGDSIDPLNIKEVKEPAVLGSIEVNNIVDGTAAAELFNKFIHSLATGKSGFQTVKYDDRGKIDYRTAAEVIVRFDHTLPEVPKADDDNYDVLMNRRNEKIAGKVEELANDYDFMFYINEKVVDGKHNHYSDIILADFVKEYPKYKERVKEKDSKVNAADIKFESEKKDQSKLPMERRNGTPFFMYEGACEKKVGIIATCQKKIDAAKGKNDPFKREDIMDAVDLIIAKTLTTKAADVAFFKRVQVEPDSTSDNPGMFTKLVFKNLTKMRMEIINDPVFRDVFARRVPRKQFYAEFQSALNRDINRKIDAEDARKSALKKDQTEMESQNNYMKTHECTVSDNDIKTIQEIHDNLVQYNMGKKPSEYMKNLMNALKDVLADVDPERAMQDINMAKLDKLNKAALKYFDKRQGIIFNPLTDDGKSRLAAVGKLIKVTEPIVKKMRADNPQISNVGKAMVK